MTARDKAILDAARSQDRDLVAVVTTGLESQDAGEEISDGCARTIASWYAEGMGPSQSFATTGAVTDPQEVYRELFYIRGRPLYYEMSPAAKLACNMLDTYLLHAGPRGPVAGWSGLWVKRS
jgi:hypothetical protein